VKGTEAFTFVVLPETLMLVTLRGSVPLFVISTVKFVSFSTITSPRSVKSVRINISLSLTNGEILRASKATIFPDSAFPPVEIFTSTGVVSLDVIVVRYIQLRRSIFPFNIAVSIMLLPLLIST
jgi:ABC-type transport system involved in cytochrome c biogenesis permease subunit